MSRIVSQSLHQFPPANIPIDESQSFLNEPNQHVLKLSKIRWTKKLDECWEEPCYTCGELFHVDGSECPRASFADDPPTNEELQTRYEMECVLCHSKSHDFWACDEPTFQSDKNQLRCMACGKFGHLNCGLEQEDFNVANLGCPNCGLTEDHTIDMCTFPQMKPPDENKPTTSYEVRCWNCDRRGHFKWQCPRARRSRDPTSTLGSRPEHTKRACTCTICQRVLPTIKLHHSHQMMPHLVTCTNIRCYHMFITKSDRDAHCQKEHNHRAVTDKLRMEFLGSMGYIFQELDSDEDIEMSPVAERVELTEFDCLSMPELHKNYLSRTEGDGSVVSRLEGQPAMWGYPNGTSSSVTVVYSSDSIGAGADNVMVDSSSKRRPEIVRIEERRRNQLAHESKSQYASSDISSSFRSVSHRGRNNSSHWNSKPAGTGSSTPRNPLSRRKSPNSSEISSTSPRSRRRTRRSRRSGRGRRDRTPPRSRSISWRRRTPSSSSCSSDEGWSRTHEHRGRRRDMRRDRRSKSGKSYRRSRSRRDRSSRRSRKSRRRHSSRSSSPRRSPRTIQVKLEPGELAQSSDDGSDQDGWGTSSSDYGSSPSSTPRTESSRHQHRNPSNRQKKPNHRLEKPNLKQEKPSHKPENHNIKLEKPSNKHGNRSVSSNPSARHVHFPNARNVHMVIRKESHNSGSSERVFADPSNVPEGVDSSAVINMLPVKHLLQAYQGNMSYLQTFAQ